MVPVRAARVPGGVHERRRVLGVQLFGVDIREARDGCATSARARRDPRAKVLRGFRRSARRGFVHDAKRGAQGHARDDSRVREQLERASRVDVRDPRDVSLRDSPDFVIRSTIGRVRRDANERGRREVAPDPSRAEPSHGTPRVGTRRAFDLVARPVPRNGEIPPLPLLPRRERAPRLHRVLLVAFPPRPPPVRLEQNRQGVPPGVAPARVLDDVSVVRRRDPRFRPGKNLESSRARRQVPLERVAFAALRPEREAHGVHLEPGRVRSVRGEVRRQRALRAEERRAKRRTPGCEGYVRRRLIFGVFLWIRVVRTRRFRMRVRIDGRDGRDAARDVARDGRHAPASGSRRPRRPSPHRRGDDAVQVRGRRRQVPKPPPPDAGAALLARSPRRRRGRYARYGRNLGPAAVDRLLRRPRQQPGQKRPRHVLHGPHDGGARETPVRARRLKVQRASRAEASLGVRDDPRRKRTSRRRPGVGVGVGVGGRLGLVAFVARKIQIQILAPRVRQPRGRRPPPRRRQHALHLRNHGRLGVHLDQRPGARHQRPRRALAGDVRSIRRAVAPSSLPLRLRHPGVEQREELHGFALPRLADQDGAVEHRRGR